MMALRTTDILIPFPIKVGLKDVIPHPAWTEAKDSVIAAVEAGGIVVLTGETGVGKSLLLQSLRYDLATGSQNVLLFPGEAETPGQALNVLLLDDADRVPDLLLRQLAEKGKCIVLAGSPGLVERTRALPGQITLVPMRVLTQDEAADFVKAELRRVGLAEDIIESDDLLQLVSRSEGRPLALRTHASLALLMARLAAADEVTSDHEGAALQRHDISSVSETQPGLMLGGQTAAAPEPTLQSRAAPPRPPLISLETSTMLTRARRFTRPTWMAAVCITALALTAVTMRPRLFSFRPPALTPTNGATIAHVKPTAAPGPIAGRPKSVAPRLLSVSPPELKLAAPKVSLPQTEAEAKSSAEAPSTPVHLEPAPTRSQVSITTPSAAVEAKPASETKRVAKDLPAPSPAIPAMPADAVPAIAQSKLANASVRPAKTVEPASQLAPLVSASMTAATAHPHLPARPKPVVRSSLSSAPPELMVIAPELHLPQTLTLANLAADIPSTLVYVEPAPTPGQVAIITPSAAVEVRLAVETKPVAKDLPALPPVMPTDAVLAIAQSNLYITSVRPPVVAEPESAATGMIPAPIPAVAALPRPPARPLHIVVAVRGRAAVARGSVAIEILRGRGLAAVLDPAPATSREPEISYFFPEDRFAALNLAHELSSNTVPRLVAARGGLPRPGTVRLALPASRQADDPVTLVMSRHR